MRWCVFLVQANDAGKRVDSICGKILAMSFAARSKAIRKKNIRLNGTRTVGSTRVRKGDKICISAMLRHHFDIKRNTRKWEDRADEKLIEPFYEKDGIALYSKAAGARLFPLEKKEAPTSSGSLLEHLRIRYARHVSLSFSPAPCHRLDTGTSGIVITAYTVEAAREVRVLQESKKVAKVYLAVLTAPLGISYLQHSLYRDTFNRRTYAVVGKDFSVRRNMRYLGEARLDVRSIGALSLGDTKAYLYAMGLRAGGKTHQIRAQCAAEGAPLWGDAKYMGRKRNTKKKEGFFLHFSFFRTQEGTIFPKTAHVPVPERWGRKWGKQGVRYFESWDRKVVKATRIPQKMNNDTILDVMVRKTEIKRRRAR